VPGSFSWMATDNHDDLRQTLIRGVDRHSGRVLMGTDYPAGMGNLDQILEQYQTVGFSETQLENMMVKSTKAFFDRFGRSRP